MHVANYNCFEGFILLICLFLPIMLCFNAQNFDQYYAHACKRFI